MNKVVQLKCPNCGGMLNVPPGATRITCQYCNSSLAVDLSKSEAMLYLADERERGRDKARLAREHDQLYEQYMAVYGEVQSLDAELARQRYAPQNRLVRQQTRQVLTRRQQLTQQLGSLQVEISKIDQILQPGIVTPLPPPAILPPPPRSNRPLVLALSAGGLLVLVLGLAVALGGFGQGQRGAQPTPTALVLLGSPIVGEATPPAPPATGYLYSKETSHSIAAFAEAYKELGGVTSLGYPITEAFVEQPSPGASAGGPLWVQYFEKAVLEYHPELPQGQQYQLARLGAWWLDRQYHGGELPPAVSLPGGDSFKFTETGHTVSGPFLTYWHKGGEVRRFGFPLTEVFEEKSEADGQTYKVQYFERAVMEYHPELAPPYDVQLTALGTLQLMQLYPGGAPGGASKPVGDKTP